MAHHKLKLLEQFADAVRSGEKVFEIRENDRAFKRASVSLIGSRSRSRRRKTHNAKLLLALRPEWFI